MLSGTGFIRDPTAVRLLCLQTVSKVLEVENVDQFKVSPCFHVNISFLRYWMTFWSNLHLKMIMPTLMNPSRLMELERILSGFISSNWSFLLLEHSVIVQTAKKVIAYWGFFLASSRIVQQVIRVYDRLCYFYNDKKDFGGQYDYDCIDKL